MAWPLREPPSINTLALLEQLQNRPQTAETHHSKHNGGDAMQHKRPDDTTQPRHQKEPPAAGAPMELRLDNYRVEQTDGEEGHSSYDYASTIQCLHCKPVYSIDSMHSAKSSGSVVDSKRTTFLPSRETTNLVKFHLMSGFLA